jgi:hypothetical protein
MKQKDIVLIIVVSFISAVFSLFISKALFSSPENRQEKVEVVEKITADFSQPDAKYFNPNAINPTQLIRIGENPNPQPFKR